MVTLKFNDLQFIEYDDKIKVIFLKHFHFYMLKKELYKIGNFNINKNYIEIDCSKQKSNKFYNYLDKGLNNLVNNITNKKTIYIHKGGDIPLIGNGSFGLVDRGTNLIEIKPICGCNLNCIYCSIDEMKRTVDFVVEKDYLVFELKKLLSIKSDDVEIHIGCQGEPLLYSPLVELVKDISSFSKVKRISMDTNATLLSEDIVDKLINAGMTRFNISINSLDKDKAKHIAGAGYAITHVKKIAEYISKKNVNMTIAPVWIQKINDNDIEEIIKFGKKLKATIGIQNYLRYKFGRNPSKDITMEIFYDKLKKLEKKYNVKLILNAEDFQIKNDKTLEKPFKKGQIIQAEIKFDGRLPREKIAVSNNRTISVFNSNKNGNIKIKILRTKHNIYSGTEI